MERQELQNLKYGIIYLYTDRNRSIGIHDPEAIVKQFVEPLQVECINDPGRTDLLLVARRFNVGNIGRYATVSLSLSRINRSGGWYEAIKHFADVLMGFTDAGGGDIVINESDYGYLHGGHMSAYETLPSAAPQDNTRVKSSKPSRLRRLSETLGEMFGRNGEVVQEICEADASAPMVNRSKKAAPSRDPLQEEEAREVKLLERGRKEALERIKRDIVNYIALYHDDPKELMAELLRGKVVVGQPGRLLVNGDMKIVLPEYDEMEIEMPAMCRTLYILFMRQSKLGRGIVLKDIDEFRDDIIQIYGLVKPGANEKRVEQSVDNLCDPIGESLNQMISRVNRCIRNVITDKELAKSYTISGKKGEPYGIALPPQYLELPRAVTGA